LIDRIKTVLSNEKGTTYIESGLWIALVVLVMAGASVKLASAMQGKFDQIQGVMDNINVPSPNAS